MRHPIETLWREVGLPEYFLGNDGSNTKLYALYDAIIHRSSERTVDDATLDRVGAAIERANSHRVYGTYDYSNYPGDAPPYVVRDERTGERLLQTWDRGEVEKLYETLKRRHIARAALDALVSGASQGGENG